MSLSGSLVPLNPPLPDVLSKNPWLSLLILIRWLWRSRSSLACSELHWKRHLGRGPDAGNGLGSDKLPPSAPLSSTAWTPGEKTGSLDHQEHEITLPLSLLPRSQGTLPALGQSSWPSKITPKTHHADPPSSLHAKHIHTEVIIADRNQFSLAKEEAP